MAHPANWRSRLIKASRKVLLDLATSFTGGNPRYVPIPGDHFEWSSKSWTHNVFRTFELVFGRKQGVRLESTTGVDKDGISWVIAHTPEAAIAYTETFVRKLFTLPKFKLVKVYVPQLAYAGLDVPTRSPYLFAIAYDATSNGTDNGATSITFSATCTGSNLAITIEGCQNAGSIATASSATYNAVSARQIITDRNTSQNTWMDILALANPATGANNVVWTSTGGGSGVSCFAMSLTGTATYPIGASAASEFTAATSKTQAVTTLQPNSVIVDNFQCNKTVTATGSGQTKRTSFTGVGGNTFHGSTMTSTTIGSYSPGYSWTGNADGSLLVAEIAEFIAFATNSLDLEASSSQYASAADSSSLSPTGAMTFECWIKWESLATSGNRVIILAKDDAQPQRSYQFGFLNNSGTYTMEILISTDGTNANTNQARVNITTPTTGVWYHYGWVYTTAATGTLEAFVDGVSQGTVSGMGGSVYDSTANVELGAQKLGGGAASNFLDGKIMLARLWDVARTGSNLTGNQCAVLGPTTNLKAEWTLNNTYADSSGNVNSLTATGSPSFSADGPSSCAVTSISSLVDTLAITESVSMHGRIGVAPVDTASITESANVQIMHQITSPGAFFRNSVKVIDG